MKRVFLPKNDSTDQFLDKLSFMGDLYRGPTPDLEEAVFWARQYYFLDPEKNLIMKSYEYQILLAMLLAQSDPLKSENIAEAKQIISRLELPELQLPLPDIQPPWLPALFLVAAQQSYFLVLLHCVKTIPLRTLISIRTRDNKCALDLALTKNNAAVIKFLRYHQLIDLDYRNSHNRTIFHEAIYQDNLNLVEQLIETFQERNFWQEIAEVDSKDHKPAPKLINPFLLAAKYGATRVLHFICESAEDKNYDYWQKHGKEAVQLVLQYADPQASDIEKSKRATILILALDAGKIDTAHGRFGKFDDHTIFQAAAYYGLTNFMHELIQRSRGKEKKIEKENEKTLDCRFWEEVATFVGNSALHLAAYGFNFRNILQLACQENPTSYVLSLLNKRNSRGATPLLEMIRKASSFSEIEAYQKFITNETIWQIGDYQGEPILHYLITTIRFKEDSNTTPWIKFCLENCDFKSISRLNRNNQSVLHVAAKSNQEKWLSVLLTNYHLEINAFDYNSHTPAMLTKNLLCLQRLHAAGADLMLKNSLSDCVFTLAYYAERYAIKTWLTRQGYVPKGWVQLYSRCRVM